ncbi:MAG: ABC-type amino acid transport system, periplasmic component [Caldanaerobacter subterraneus]|nr:MAG: ABC-type amino acid transport system, periplasmic component [Caldanaerobacter subterraneus]
MEKFSEKLKKGEEKDMNKKSLFLAFAVIFALAFMVSGCGSKFNTVDQIKQKGVIVMGTSADFPPFEFHKVEGGKDEIVGFDIDIANAIAKKLGVKLEIKDMDFKGLIPALQAGRVDMVIAGMTPTAERKKSVDFSDLYYDSRQVVVVKNDSPISKFDDLKGKTVAVQIGTTSEEAAKKIPDVKLKQLNRVSDEFMDLQNGRCDAIVVEDTVAKAYLKEYKDMKILYMDEINDVENGSAVAVAKGNKSLLDVVNEVIKELKQSGEYDKLVDKWFKQ